MTNTRPNETTLPSVLYHGGNKLISKFNIPPQGAYFSPHVEWAENYGDHITRATVHANKVYRIDYSHDMDEEIIDALFDRDYQTVAEFIKVLQAQGYQAMQTQSDSEMVIAFPGTRIEVLDNERTDEHVTQSNYYKTLFELAGIAHLPKAKALIERHSK